MRIFEYATFNPLTFQDDVVIRLTSLGAYLQRRLVPSDPVVTHGTARHFVYFLEDFLSGHATFWTVPPISSNRTLLLEIRILTSQRSRLSMTGPGGRILLSV